MVDWGEIEIGIELPLNFTLMLIVEFGSLVPLPMPQSLSISPFPI